MEEHAAVTLERLISVIGVLVLLGGILLTAGQQMERLNQLNAKVERLEQKLDSVMVYIGDQEAAKWRAKKAAR